MAIIELFGVPRLRAGTARFACDAATLADALRSLVESYPGLAGTVISGASVLPAYLLSLNGDRFVSDPSLALEEGDVILLLSTDVGG